MTYLDTGYQLELEGDAAAAERASEEIAAAAEQFGDPVLGCFALVSAGLAAVRGGDVDSGFGLLDEAMLPVVLGSVPPIWSGDIYCSVVHLCEGLGDIARMRAWTDAMETWASPLSRHFTYYGVSRVHRFQLLSAEGDWDAVEQELGRESERLSRAHGWVAGEGYRELGDVRRLRGDADGARAAYARARDLGIDPQPGEALLLAAAGGHERAMSLLRAALAEAGRLGGSRILLAAVEVALESGQLAEARRLTAELEATAHTYASPGIRARADQARARVLLADRVWDQALTRLESAAETPREQRFRYATAQVHELMAAARRGRGEADAAAADDATALAIYRSPGAGPDVARLVGEAAPGGLTARELEVLACVASGASNRRVSGALVISEKTVGRHLANIYLKIGVSSRTAAAGWARDHGVVPRDLR